MRDKNNNQVFSEQRLVFVIFLYFLEKYAMAG